MLGYPTAHGSRCGALSKKYKCRYISVANTVTRTNNREREVNLRELPQHAIMSISCILNIVAVCATCQINRP